MSDEPEPYTNLDLEVAEQLLIAAGKPELAHALNFHAQGVRNLVQGEWGKSFVASLEMMLTKHISPLAATQGTLLAVVEETAQEVKKLAAEIGDLGLTLTHVIGQVSDLQETVQDHSQTLAEHATAIQQTRTELTHFQTEVRTKFQQLESVLTKLATQQAMFQKLLAAHPAPDALKK